MRVAIIGSRNCQNLTEQEIARHIPADCTQVISGGAAGVDSLAEKAARLRGIPFVALLPDYASFGKNAPLLRNAQIVAQADLVLAFWDYASKGTAHTIAQCIQKQVPVEIVALGHA